MAHIRQSWPKYVTHKTVQKYGTHKTVEKYGTHKTVMARFFSLLSYMAHIRQRRVRAERMPQLRIPGTERLVFYCRTTSASTAPRTPRRTCCPYAYVLITVLRVSRSCGLFPDGFDLLLLHNLAHTRQSRPDSGLGFAVKVFKRF